MSGAERHVVTGTTRPKHEGGEREYFTAIVVLAADYDRDTARLRKEKSLAIAGMLENHNAFVKEFEAGTVTLLAERDELRAQVEAMRAALRIFVGCAYPVAATINQRGHNWCEAYLDQALETGLAALQAKP